MLDFLAALKRPIRAEDLEELKRAREEADRKYNDGLTALEQAMQRAPDMPHPPPSLDELQITPLNELWNILPADPAAYGVGWAGRLRLIVWRMLAPIFDKQQAFNSALVDHVNRNVPVQREITKASASTLALLRDQLAALEAFQAHLIQYLQQITLFIDTKDREHAGYLEHRIVGLSAGLDGVSDELQKRWESMVARERRFETRLAPLPGFEASVAAVQRLSATLKRELERVIGIVSSAAPAEAAAGGASAIDVRSDSRGPVTDSSTARPIDSYKYVGFEDEFRGTREDIRKGLADYVAMFEGARGVLDIGCGRGEFLDLLRERGIDARGLDINHEMVEVCRGRGLDVTEGDALTFLAGLPDESLGGLLAAQVVEHLQPDYLLRLLDVAFQKLRPGSMIILETINPACWFAFFESYIRDITHVRPLHPETLEYLLVASGFQRVEVQFRAPYPEHEKLQRIAPTSVEEGTPSADALISSAADTFNANVEKINRLLFTYLDYAAIGWKL